VQDSHLCWPLSSPTQILRYHALTARPIFGQWAGQESCQRNYCGGWTRVGALRLARDLPVVLEPHPSSPQNASTPSRPRPAASHSRDSRANLAPSKSRATQTLRRLRKSCACPKSGAQRLRETRCPTQKMRGFGTLWIPGLYSVLRQVGEFISNEQALLMLACCDAENVPGNITDMVCSYLGGD
jgi:hypothetical protein